MKRLLLSAAVALLTTLSATAIPAHKGTFTVQQPDGTTVTLRLVGDEYLHFNTTTDGYTVVQDAHGAYVYAQRAGDRLVASGVVAHDATARTADEQQWLGSVTKHLTPKMNARTAQEQTMEQDRRAQARRAQYDYSNFKGLIILVEYNDKSFSRSDYVDIINDMVNKENYTGYSNTGYGRYTGSVRDYFYDNSFGVFSPQFDIVGPVKVNRSQYYAEGTNNSNQLTYDAITAADSLVNYADYDRDGDGNVDMVYFIFAGIGSNIGGNDSRLIWPHAGSLYTATWRRYRKDGVYLGRYACSTELYGSASSNILDGIGVISHEFSHVLGLPDLYDTDYEGSGGETSQPDEWCIMASGGYLNNGRTPAGYSLYERYAAGFATPQVIDSVGSYSLPPLGTSNEGLRLNTRVNKEYFLLENRQKTNKWDAYLTGHGMLVFRVDSTNAAVWQNNTLNCNPDHMYFELRRAGGGSGSSGSDPFPGTKLVRSLNNVTTPANLLTWSGQKSPFGLEKIREQGGTIYFSVVDVNVLQSISLPESVSVGKGFSYQLQEVREPDYAPYTLQWSSADTSIATVSSTGLVTGVAEGTTTITVMANGSTSLMATCTVTVTELEVVANIADFKQLPEQSESVLHLENALVVFGSDEYMFVRDATGAIRFNSADLPLATGYMINGDIYGRYTVDDNIPQFEFVEGISNTNNIVYGKGHTVTPREVQLANLSASDYADLITLKAVPLVRSSGYWIDTDPRIRLYNTFQISGISIPKTVSGKYFDVTGIYMTDYLSGSLIDEISLTQSPVEVDGPNAISSTTIDQLQAGSRVRIYTTDGRLVADTTADGLRLLQLPRGIYVLRADNVVRKVVW